MKTRTTAVAYDNTLTFKAKAVLEMLKEEKTLSQLASQYQVHVNQLRDLLWRVSRPRHP